MIDTAIRPEFSVATVVTNHPECAVVFQHYRIDYCCNGQLSLETATLQRGVNIASLVHDLEAAIARRETSPKPTIADLATPKLINYIVTTHHAYLRETLPFLNELAAKVARVHGSSSPHLTQLGHLVRQLSVTLLPHLDDEENHLFPRMLAPVAGDTELARLLTSMHSEHFAVGQLLSEMRDLTDDFTLPSNACNSYRTLYSELEQLTTDIHHHVHIENHILAPRFG